MIHRSEHLRVRVRCSLGCLVLLVGGVSCSDESTRERAADADVIDVEDAAVSAMDANTMTSNPAPSGVSCGNTMCSAPLSFLGACCFDPETSTCGTKWRSNPCAAPVESHPGCPSTNLLGVLTVPSCCTESMQCGLELATFGITGCTDLTTLREQYGTSLPVALPSPQPCGGFPDAGMADAVVDADVDADVDAEVDGDAGDAETSDADASSDDAGDADLPDADADDASDAQSDADAEVDATQVGQG